jgi:predicted dehydrogenase
LVVAAPTTLHADWASRALEQDCPLLLEKPLAAEIVDVELIVGLARKVGVPLMCGLLERFNPAVRTAAAIADAPVHVTTARHSPYVPRIETGVAQDLLIHDVDLVLRLAGGEPSQIFARFGFFDQRSRHDAEDLAEVVCDFDGALVASLSASRLSQRKVRSLVITEVDRLIEVDMVRSDITIYRHVGNAPLGDDGLGYRQQTIIDIPAIHDAREPLAAQLERFIALVNGEADWQDEMDSLLPPHAVLAEITRVARSASELQPGAS